MNGIGKRKRRLLLMLLAGTLLLGGCRVRTTPDIPAQRDGPRSGGAVSGTERKPDGETAGTETRSGEAELSDTGDETRDDPEADRKEYDEAADAEIIPGASHTAAGEGAGEPAGRESAETDLRGNLLDDEAQKTATRVVSTGEAERKGVADDAKPAETAADYYRVLLADRTGTLMECQRLYVYWETDSEWRTVYRTSPEHRMILDSGCYDVSGRLSAERLQVDAGWVIRKNPDVIVRAVPAGILGSGVYTADAAEMIRNGMFRREGWDGIRAVQTGRVVLISREMTEAPHLKLAAELLIAKTTYPELMRDVDVREALKALTEEATGSIPEAMFFYEDGE